MSDGIQRWLQLPDARLLELAAASGGAWLWSADTARLIWANPAGRAVLAAGPVDPSDPQRRQLVRLVPDLGESPRLHRLRGFGAPLGGLMTCACSQLTLAGGDTALLVVAMERMTPSLRLRERLAQLVAQADRELAAFTADGRLAGLSAGGRAVLGAVADLGALGAADAAAVALREGEATAAGRSGRLTLVRLGRGREAGLIARPSADFVPLEGVPAPAPDPAAQRSAAAAPPPLADSPPLAPAPCAAPSRPLRFLWQMDAAGRFSFGCDPFTRLIGPRVAGAFGRPWTDINAALHLDPDDRLLRAMATQRTFSGITVHWPVADGAMRLPVELSALPICDRARGFLGYRGFGVCRDPDALARLAEMRRTAATLAPPDDAPPQSSRPPMDSPRPIDPPPPNVLPFRTAGGEAVATLTPVENNAFHELARQLSERLEHPVAAPHGGDAEQSAEPAPPRAEVALRAMLDAVADAVLTLTPEGKVRTANRAAQTMFGIGDAPLAPHSLFDLLVPADHQAARDMLAATAPQAVHQVQGRTRDGRVLELTMTLPRAADGTAFAIFRDRTPEQEREREIAELRGRLSQAAAETAGLAGWASRSLREPAEAIVSLAEAEVERRFEPSGGQHDVARLRDIRGAAQRIVGMLDELRDFARVESGEAALTPASVNLNDVVEQAIAAQQAEAGRARVIIRSSLAPALPPVRADAASLRRIATNLIALSIHLAGAGGQAIVSTARADDGRVMLRLRDTGPGLSEAELAAIADPFRAAPSDGRAMLANAGMSLALTRALIKANDAMLAIRSAAPSGTLIEVALIQAGRGDG